MRARSALFDLYGDHLRGRGGRAPVAALVRLMAPLGIAAPAVRTAVSRMVQQGWLQPVRTPSGPGYALTAKAVRRLDDAATRIYRTGRPVAAPTGPAGTAPESWDGNFELIVLQPPTERAERARLAESLRFLGYGAIETTTWIAVRPAHDVEGLMTEMGVRFERFRAAHADGVPGAMALVRRAWDLAEIGRAYDEFVQRLRPVVTPAPRVDEAAYAARFQLVHAWRTFLFRDPQLPSVLLPEPWPGTTAAAFFDQHAARLRPAADRYVDRCLEPVLI